MTNTEAILIAEGATPQGNNPGERTEKFVAAWQHLIDTGLCWQLQGHFGRTATWLIEQDICTPAGGVQ